LEYDESEWRAILKGSYYKTTQSPTDDGPLDRHTTVVTAVQRCVVDLTYDSRATAFVAELRRVLGISWLMYEKVLTCCDEASKAQQSPERFCLTVNEQTLIACSHRWHAQDKTRQFCLVRQSINQSMILFVLQLTCWI